MAASPDARSAVLEWLGLKSVKIERREPSAPAPQPGHARSGLGLGTPVTLAEARERAPFLRLPEADGLGRPTRSTSATAASRSVYGERRGYARSTTTGAAVLVQEFPARVGPFIEKTLGAAAGLERLRVDGATRRTSSPAPTASPTSDDDGVRFEDSASPATRCSSSAPDGLLMRVEGDLARDARRGDRGVGAVGVDRVPANGGL